MLTFAVARIECERQLQFCDLHAVSVGEKHIVCGRSGDMFKSEELYRPVSLKLAGKFLIPFN